MTEREELTRAIERRNREIRRAERSIRDIEDAIQRREMAANVIRGCLAVAALISMLSLLFGWY